VGQCSSCQSKTHAPLALFSFPRKTNVEWHSSRAMTIPLPSCRHRIDTDLPPCLKNLSSIASTSKHLCAHTVCPFTRPSWSNPPPDTQGLSLQRWTDSRSLQEPHRSNQNNTHPSSAIKPSQATHCPFSYVNDAEGSLASLVPYPLPTFPPATPSSFPKPRHSYRVQYFIAKVIHLCWSTEPICR